MICRKIFSFYIITSSVGLRKQREMVKIGLVGDQNERLIMELAIRKIKHRSMNKLGPEYSSDDSGDGPIIITASLLIDLGHARSNVSLTVSVKGGNFFAAWRANTGKELRRVYNLEKLSYSEKGQHASLEGDGFRLIADQMAMRMLFSRTPIRRAGVPMSTITIVLIYIESHGEKLPNYPISITLEGGVLKEFHLESVLIKEIWGDVLNMRRKPIRDTDQWEIGVEGLTFRAEWTAAGATTIWYSMWRGGKLVGNKLHMLKCSPQQEEQSEAGKKRMSSWGQSLAPQ